MPPSDHSVGEYSGGQGGHAHDEDAKPGLTGCGNTRGADEPLGIGQQQSPLVEIEKAIAPAFPEAKRRFAGGVLWIGRPGPAGLSHAFVETDGLGCQSDRGKRGGGDAAAGQAPAGAPILDCIRIRLHGHPKVFGQEAFGISAEGELLPVQFEADKRQADREEERNAHGANLPGRGRCRQTTSAIPLCAASVERILNN